MAKQIWLGPILGSNRERLVERCADLISQDQADSFLYLAASHPLLELVTDRLLDGARNRGVWGSLPVYLFRGLVRQILANAVEADTGLPLAPRIPIDQETTPLKRSLLAQLIRRLNTEGRLRAIGPLSNREGCVNSVASLIGEIQRAGKTPGEFRSIVEARMFDLADARIRAAAEAGPSPNAQRDSTDANDSATESAPSVPLQIDFDRDVALIYSEYASALDRFRLTEDDADQLRALQVLRGELSGKAVSVPWLASVRLLVLDGFFDFTPVQGEMLRVLIPCAPEVAVNLNRDRRNPDIFRPFDQTIEQLLSMAEFDLIESRDTGPVAGTLAGLRERLFNTSSRMRPESDEPDLRGLKDAADTTAEEDTVSPTNPNIRLFESSDRSMEIRAIAKEIKRLVLIEGYSLADIALVVRERASYAETIVRVLDEEAIPCALERRAALAEAPAVRAAVKLLQLLRERDRDEGANLKVGELAGLIKSGYFRLSDGELAALTERFHREQSRLLNRGRPESIGRWDADELENVIAYVGAELRVESWLKRARLITSSLPAHIAGHSSQPDDEADELPDDPDDDLGGRPRSEVDRKLEDVSFARPAGYESKRRIAREVHPGSIAWAALELERLAQSINAVPRDGRPARLRDALMSALDRLQFAATVKSSAGLRDAAEESGGLARIALDLRGLEGLRRAFAAAIRSIEIASAPEQGSESSAISLAAFIDEVLRCVRAQTLALSGAEREGLQVLEATDVRGLRFKAVFIAGLVEGGFPLRAPRDWIYPHDERERLKQYGLTLEDISPDTLLKEEHYFYQTACRATERLYLTRPTVLEAGAETVASYYIDEISRAVSPFPITAEMARRDFDGRELFAASTPSELAISLVRHQERHFHRANRDGLLSLGATDHMISWAGGKGYLSSSAIERIAIERERAGPRFGRFDGTIAEPHLVAMMAELYGGDHVFSASELSLYGKCPFKFFAQRVLKLEPRGEAALDLSALDAGKLLHEVLRRFLERRRGQRLTDTDRAALLEELRRAADEVFDEHERQVPPLNPQVWRLDREIRKVLLEQVLAYELSVQEKTEQADMRPAFFELAFGMAAENADPHSADGLVMFERQQAGEAEQALVRGQIDRVDVGEPAGEKTAVAYDYKLSRGASLDDMREGRDLQLHIYLAALEQIFLPEARIAGGGYYILRGNERGRNRGLYRGEMSACTGIPNNVTANLDEADWRELRAEMERRIWEFIDGMRAARFVVAPSAPGQTCSFCDYSAICRYERFRINRKLERG